MKNAPLSILVIFIFCLCFASNAQAQWSQNSTTLWTTSVSQNVGIGTGNPTSKLHVNGALTINKNWDGVAGINLTSDKPSIAFNSGQNNQKWLMHVGSDYNGAFELFNSTNSSWGTPKFSIAPVTGEVRMGQVFISKDYNGSDGGLTLNGNRPTIRLNSTETNQKWLVHVGSDYNGAFELFNSTNGVWGPAKFSVAPVTGDVRTGQVLITKDYNGSDGGLTLNGNRPTIRLNSTETNQKWLVHVGSDYNGAFQLFNSTNGVWGPAKFSIAPGTGAVAIGTALMPAGYKLSVGGRIICEELKVQLQSAWPDYVFATGYPLQPLEAVAQHIAEQGHLSNIPSACDMEENGLPIGEMQTKMMEKIEELTLYLIELNKENKVLQQRVAQLESHQ